LEDFFFSFQELLDEITVKLLVDTKEPISKILGYASMQIVTITIDI